MSNTVLRIRIRMDSNHKSNPDEEPDPLQSQKQEPNPDPLQNANSGAVEVQSGDIEAHPAAGVRSPVAADWQYFDAVLGIRIKNWIRIRRIRMFSGLPDPAPDSLVRGTDPEPSLFL